MDQKRGIFMKAIVYTKYGPPEVLQLKEVEKSTPKDNEVLIRVYATTVTSGDVKARSATFTPVPLLLGRMQTGLTKPKKTTPGMELAVGTNCRGSQLCIKRAQKGKCCHNCGT
ncbi:unnamed protein product [marine sediment metagenome]|uniref:Uncharacterized protein n=1 Tax=marine sediment metagenome TaxID=412755 RepID=X1MXW2_9ZZZZ